MFISSADNSLEFINKIYFWHKNCTQKMFDFLTSQIYRWMLLMIVWDLLLKFFANSWSISVMVNPIRKKHSGRMVQISLVIRNATFKITYRIYPFNTYVQFNGGVSNREPYDCLLNRLFSRRSKTASKLRVTGRRRGIHRWPVNSPHEWPVTRKKVSIWWRHHE